ncbi:G-protein-signaling modulator 2-like isoform X2 [Ctenocephalides felis]|uniref:G-protein-signaling modulator 2-like isoform X2 n=1 Tax=Ctenocephalides felis TaxID=7515 RepID=UPI000E6E2C1E|nr:G-protein-signaling modulator 2-like isoform X2 [Ctenocephalides felis]
MSSSSASGENLTTEYQNFEGSTMCLELALEGERLCKSGDCRAGIAFFQAAIQAGTDDLRTLSAIYSQLGNAYFYLGEYNQAMQYHKLDLTLARTMNDKLGEAKSSGNLGNTLKVMGRFQEAALCCERHLSIARELKDRASEGRALYNLGNVFHAQGKHLGHRSRNGTENDYQDSNEDNIEVRACLEKAVQYYQKNLKLMEELCDHAAQGRACGNLGNTLYLLGDFYGAIEYHTRRLEIAKEFGDRQAERRAHSNLGNSHIFLGEFETAADHYKRTLLLAQELDERAVEAQACYSLGNTYTLLRDYDMAIGYHQRHLAIARQLGDRVGEARASWSLGNAHSALGAGHEEKALYYAGLHLDLSRELNDRIGEATALCNIEELHRVLGINSSACNNAETEVDQNSETTDITHANSDTDGQASSDTVTTAVNAPYRKADVDIKCQEQQEQQRSANNRVQRVRRQSMEQLDLIKLTPDGKSIPNNQSNTRNDIKKSTLGSLNFASKLGKSHKKKEEEIEEESFFDLLSRFQSGRMEDQRCSLNVGENKENCRTNNIATNKTNSEDKDPGIDLLDMIEGLQGNRMDEQRVYLPHLPGSKTTKKIQQQPDEKLLDMIIKSQASRLEEQRSDLPDTSHWQSSISKDEAAFEIDYCNPQSSNQHSKSTKDNNNDGTTVPDEDFFSLIMKIQSGRMDDQRASINIKRVI